MPTLIGTPTRIEAAGNKPKLIDEYIGRVNSRMEALSIAQYPQPERLGRAGADAGIRGIHDRPERRAARAYRGGHLDVYAGQAVIAHAGEWVQYSTPDPAGAEYIAVCLPAFSPALVHRDEEG